MRRTFARWFGPAVLALVVGAAEARAQGAAEGGESGGRNPAVGYVLATVFTVGAMLLVCFPTRKQRVD